MKQEITKDRLTQLYNVHGNVRGVAYALGCSQTTAWKLLKKIGIDLSKKRYEVK